MTSYYSFLLSSQYRHALPIAMYPGIHLTGASVQDIATKSSAQFEAQAALHDRYRTNVVLTGMDLSVEAEAFGSKVQFYTNEIPTIIDRLIIDQSSIKSLVTPTPGDKRTKVYLDVAAQLKELSGKPFVLGGMIGPFTLAGRLFGVSELLELTIEDPNMVHLILAKTTNFLVQYGSAFKEAGVNGLIIAEPAAGLLSPKSLAIFSSTYIKQIQHILHDNSFTLILHNCGAKINHIKAILESHCTFYHFGVPMDILQTLGSVNNNIVIGGNLDPSSVFIDGSARDVYNHTTELLSLTASNRNFVISSGCDIPPNVTIEKLDGFYNAVDDFNDQ